MKQITAITAQKNSKTRVNLYLDNKFFCGMELLTVMSERLKVGQTVSEKQLENIVFEAEYSLALNKALNYISKSMHTKSQLIKYLKGKQYSPKIVDAVMDKLTEYGYVDDLTFANQFTELKKQNSGKRKIAFELKQKGVDNKVIDEVLDKIEDESDACLRVAEKYIKDRELDLKLRQSAYRYLLSKGFDYETVKEVLDKFYDEDN